MDESDGRGLMDTSTLERRSSQVNRPLSARRRIYSFFAISLIWTISLIVLLIGLPIMIVQTVLRVLRGSPKLSMMITSVITLCCTDEKLHS